ncbi:Hsp20/alpha crystallin family protein [Candidatus Nitrosopumilus sp. SW]|uniref:Hsp20/alpha crystallin family protein n=1 Tax=Candidatus Nitrosopumilus sp. SW TaxID=2508726 RepID=UPI001152D9BC|nr:Hsp20/alpha crystallin family protein [Candidatus Nitrosopumilus sp. SW]QDI89391.1 Hsp20/alpha crystallin family protein [Candidatus Nitrosopumilus sp. SW]
MKEDFEIRTILPSISSLIDDIEHRILSPLSYLKEFDNHWALELDLPMVNKKDIKVTFDGNMINVEAKLKENYSEEKLGKVSKFEYFKKSVSLPNMADTKGISAKFQKGRLEIKIPKKSTGRSIKIS